MKKKQINIYALYTLFFMFTFIVIFLAFFLKRNSFISLTDGYFQSFPVFVYIREYITNIFKGNLVQFDFKIGLGDDVLQTMNYYGLFDIFSIVSVFLFPAKYVEYAYNFSVLLKLYASGMAFIYYIQSYVKSKGCAVIGALLYAFNVYALYWGLFFIPYLTAMITFPLIIKGIDELCEKNVKISKVMIAALFIQGMTGFYHLYMEIVITIIYFIFVAIFRLWKRKDLGIKEIFSITFNVAINGILGVGLSAVVLFPAIKGLFGSTRELGKIETSLLCEFDKIASAVGDLIVPNVNHTFTTLSIIAIGSILFYIGNKNKKKEFLYLTIMLWLLTWCPVFGSIMNGLSYSTDRWYFILHFFFSIVAVLALDSAEKAKKVQIGIYVLFSSIILIMHLSQNERTTGNILRVVIFFIMTGVFVWIYNAEKDREKKILMYGCLVVMVMGLFVFGPKVLGGAGYSSYFKESGVYQEIVESDDEVEKALDGFERWDFKNSSLGASIVADYNGTVEFFSTLNSNTSNFYREMYISHGIGVADFALEGIDGRKEIMSLLSVSKYMDPQSEEDEYIIRDNLFYLPLGFTYEEYMLESEFDKLTPLEKTSQILKTIVIAEDNVSYVPNLEKADNKVFSDVKLNYKIRGNAGDRKVYIPIEEYLSLWEQGKGEIYVFLDELHGNNAKINIGNKKITVASEENVYYTGPAECLVNVSEIKRDSIGYYFNIDVQGESDFEESKMDVYWHYIDEDVIEERKKSFLTNLQIEHNLVKGKITTEKDEVLFLSIPYSTGWEAYVDKKETDILKANIGFMAIPLNEGSHEIELVYHTPGLKMGLMCSLFSLIMVIGLSAVNRKNKF